MPGLKGQMRTPRAPVRLRRNAANLATQVSFVDPALSVIHMANLGYLVLALDAAGGLGATPTQDLTVKLETVSGLSLTTTGLKIGVVAPITLGTSDISLTLAATPGLELNSGALQVQVPTGNLTVRDATGIHTDEDELFRRAEMWA